MKYCLDIFFAVGHLGKEHGFMNCNFVFLRRWVMDSWSGRGRLEGGNIGSMHRCTYISRNNDCLKARIMSTLSKHLSVIQVSCFLSPRTFYVFASILEWIWRLHTTLNTFSLSCSKYLSAYKTRTATSVQSQYRFCSAATELSILFKYLIFIQADSSTFSYSLDFAINRDYHLSATSTPKCFKFFE